MSRNFVNLPPRRSLAPLFVGVCSAALLSVASTPAQAGEQPAQSAADKPIELGPLRVEDQNPNPLSKPLGLPTLPSTVQDTPQSIIIIGQQQLREQGINSLEGALRNVPGVTVAIGEGGVLNGDQFKIRGFDAQNDMYIDGLRDFGVYTRDSFAYEEVQVLRGPSGSMFGRGSAGGVINTVSKTPFLGSLYSADGYAGNGAYYRGLVDVNKQVGETSAIRVNLMGTATHTVARDRIQSDRWGGQVGFATGIGTNTQLTLNYLHQSDDRVPDYGLPVVQIPGSIIMNPVSEFEVRRSSNTGFSSDRDKTTADIFTARVAHRAADWLTVTSDTRGGFYSRYFQFTPTSNCDTTAATANCAGRLFGANPETAAASIGGPGPYNMRAWGLQNISTARANYNIGMFRSETLAGFDVSYQDNKRSFWYYTIPSAADFTYDLGNGSASRANIGRNLFNPDPNTPPNYFAVFNSDVNCTTNPCTFNGLTSTATPTSNARTAGQSTDVALFLTERFWFTDQLSLIGGIRYDWFAAQFSTFQIGGASSSLKAVNGFAAPRASVVYEPDANQTYYFTWGRAARPQGANVVGDGTALALASRDLKPEISESFEFGAKYAMLDGRLAVTGAIFSQQKNNATQTDPLSGFLLAQSGEKQKVKGIELGLTGKILPQWSVMAGWSHLQSETLEAYIACAALTPTTATGVACPTGSPVGTLVLNDALIGRQVIFVPKNAVTFWTSYDASEFVPGLGFGGGVRYQSKMNTRYQALSPVGAPALATLTEIPDSVTVDAFVAYQFGNYRLALNMYNLTDRLNYVQAFTNRAVPAPGRSFIFSLGVRF